MTQIVVRSIASATASPRTEYALAVVERETAALIRSGRLATDPHQHMVEEGVIREHVFKAGRWRDSVVHAILEREWASPKS
ncbi:hypothetical protein [Streptomyces flaveolus]|uniref:hypothetical protein n=1 Tax=Streptomyces flaveolus TaxID=67297 RepID=UPI0036F52B31